MQKSPQYKLINVIHIDSTTQQIKQLQFEDHPDNDSSLLSHLLGAQFSCGPTFETDLDYFYVEENDKATPDRPGFLVTSTKEYYYGNGLIVSYSKIDEASYVNCRIPIAFLRKEISFFTCGNPPAIPQQKLADSISGLKVGKNGLLTMAYKK